MSQRDGEWKSCISCLCIQSATYSYHIFVAYTCKNYEILILYVQTLDCNEMLKQN